MIPKVWSKKFQKRDVTVENKLATHQTKAVNDGQSSQFQNWVREQNRELFHFLALYCIEIEPGNPRNDGDELIILLDGKGQG